MFKVKGNSPKVREVELKQVDDGVIIAVNGWNIAKLNDNDDRLLLLEGVTKEQTGLDDSYGGHIRTVWISDAETSRGNKAGGYSR